MVINTTRNAPIVEAVDKYYFLVHPNTPTGRLITRNQSYQQIVPAEGYQRCGASAMRQVGRCSRKDVLEAFRIVSREIRIRCRRGKSKALTQAEACRLALRIRDQRELIRELTDSHDWPRARRLLRLNQKLRQYLVAIAETAGLNTNILIFE